MRMHVSQQNTHQQIKIISIHVPEGIVAVISGQVKMLGTSSVVNELYSHQVKLRNFHHTVDSIAMYFITFCKLT